MCREAITSQYRLRRVQRRARLGCLHRPRQSEWLRSPGGTLIAVQTARRLHHTYAIPRNPFNVAPPINNSMFIQSHVVRASEKAIMKAQNTVERTDERSA